MYVMNLQNIFGVDGNESLTSDRGITTHTHTHIPVLMMLKAQAVVWWSTIGHLYKLKCIVHHIIECDGLFAFR